MDIGARSVRSEWAPEWDTNPETVVLPSPLSIEVQFKRPDSKPPFLRMERLVTWAWLVEVCIGTSNMAKHR